MRTACSTPRASRSSRSTTTPTGARRTRSRSSTTCSASTTPTRSTASTPPTTAGAGGVVAALTGGGVAADALPPITGQDAEIAAIQRILAGEQEMTIYKPIPIEAETAAEVAVALANGDEVPATSETGIEQSDYEGVTSYIFTPDRRHAGQCCRHDHRGRLLHRCGHLHRRVRQGVRGGWHLLMTTAQAAPSPAGDIVLSPAGVTKRFGAVRGPLGRPHGRPGG
ncbi:substrate-binding domain-containing protein [Nocardioides sp. B-3]|uniref:substrate-binding domain-containing protein n=1 Tax=Nocardioides sp. B-3 TaxID=2895565 RepID=UPI0021539CCC|nr:substrate-binding domain-containing protein [Nocardioides sp. B-3]